MEYQQKVIDSHLTRDSRWLSRGRRTGCGIGVLVFHAVALADFSLRGILLGSMPEYTESGTKDYFERFGVALQEVNGILDEQEAKKRLVELLYSFGNLPSVELPPERIEQDYQLFRRCIADAGDDLQAYFDSLLVQDILPRVQPHPFVRDIADPLRLIDFIGANAHNPRIAFEAARALRFGALFFEYQSYFGNPKDIREQFLFPLDVYLQALFSLGGARNTRMYHKIQSEGGRISAHEIRVPLVDRTDDKRISQDENFVMVSLRPFTVSGEGRRSLSGHCICESRVKGRFSTALKSVRKGLPVKTIKDCLGAILYLYPNPMEDVKEMLDAVVRAIDDSFIVDSGDKKIHPLRQSGQGKPNKHDAENESESSNFFAEKRIIMWGDPEILAAREAIDANLPFSKGRSRENFWNQYAAGGKPILAEIQVGLMTDFLSHHLVGGDENHWIYKIKQAAQHKIRVTEDALTMFDRLLPRALFGVDFHDRTVVQALINKQIAQLGAHQKALEAAELQ